MASTQDHLPIQDIIDDVVILKDGSMAVVLETSAVNFGLLSDNEQFAIISSFAGMLNSLSFSIQIVIRSKRLDITQYLSSLDRAQSKQSNKLLYQMIDRYRQFIKDTVRENEVLDKRFFIVIPLSYLEVGLRKDIKSNFKKAMTILLPRRDHLIRQLARTGLRADQLGSDELAKLFYDIYNGDEKTIQAQAPKQEIAPASAQQAQPSSPSPKPSSNVPVSPPIVQVKEVMPTLTAPAPITNSIQPPQPSSPPVRKTSPFVVEELPDDFSTI